MSGRSLRSVIIQLLLACGTALQAQTNQEKAAQLIKERRFPEAQALLDRILQADPRNAQSWSQLGELHLASRDAEKALECADRAIGIDSGKAGYHLLRGSALLNRAQQVNMFRGLGLASDGRAALERAAQLEPANRRAVLALFGYYTNAPGIAGGSLGKAQALAERTQAVDAANGHYMKGQLHKKRKDPGAAQVAYRQALAADPEFSAVYNDLGYVELEMKQVDMALEHFRKQVELDPANPNSYDSLGDGWMAKGQVEEGIRAYRKALSLNPLFSASMRSLGKALEQAGRRDEAIQHYRQCAQLGTQHGIAPMVKAAKERLAALGVKE